MNLKSDGNMWDEFDLDQPTPESEFSTPRTSLLRNLMLQDEMISFPFSGTSSIPYEFGGYGPPRLDTASSFNNRSFHSGKSEVPAESPTSNINQDSDRTFRIEKKREADRKYRTLQKESRQKLIEDWSKFAEENRRLTIQNDILKHQKDEMGKDLQSSNVETKLLKTEICKLKGKIIVQETLVETFSQKVIDNDREEEVAELKRKFAVISGQTKWENWMSEKEKLLKKVADLEHQNKILKVQVNTLCLRISNPTEIDSEKGQ
jgi:hypothetical protein